MACGDGVPRRTLQAIHSYDLLLDKIGTVEGRSVLELGVGNDYFARLMSRQFWGRGPQRFVITD